ncbi:MAG: sigma-70 family RNA polymerase sigma factor [Bacteroidia bacterium]|nr:sigma-70 family RNA polymerase sigma factor [Bacteroidia bacterium]
MTVRKTRKAQSGYDTLSDHELVEIFISNQDGAALNILLNRYDRYIFGIAWPILKHQEEVRDLKQDLYLKLNKKLNTHAPTGTFRVWLGRVVRNHCYDLLRKKMPEAWEELPEREFDDIDDADMKMDFGTIRECVEQLNPQQRLYVEMAFFKGMKNAEITKTMNWPKNRARALYDNSLKKLRKCMGHLFDEYKGYFDKD